MSCHDEVLEAVRQIVLGKRKNQFTVREILEFMRESGTVYTNSTITTHVVSRCCVDSPKHHMKTYDYFTRSGNDRGVYSLCEPFNLLEGNY